MDASAIKLVHFIILFVLSWQAIFKIPNIAISVVLKFLNILLCKFSEYLKSPKLKEISAIFPETLLKAQRFQSVVRDDYKMLIVCPTCYCTYEYEDCLSKKNGGNITSCTFVRFPKHSQARMRERCGTPLLKTVRTSSKKTLLRPVKVFCYRSLIEQIRMLVCQSNMLDIFSHWKNRVIPAGIMADIYDGEVWKSFLTDDKGDLLANRYTIGLTLNVDWFKPYKHVEYSVGAIYIAILNYPRKIRYLQKNVLLVGILPGPHEPSKQMNPFIEHLVRDLLMLWKGVDMETPEGTKLVRACLLCVSCDIPASRKLVGFVGHSALKACSKCLKSFPTTSFGKKADYSGFQRDTWTNRELKDHKEQGMKWKHAKSLAERIEIERKHGVRFSELLRLPYFNTIRFCVIDPMHNILLGSSKHITTLWKSMGLLKEVELIQELVDKFVTPSDIGRIPYKIASGFSSFTADQWKNWILIYSLVALKESLPDYQYQCWYIFVQVCLLISSRAISQDNVRELDRLLIKFCTTVETIFGVDACTPNLHLHGHLKDCYLDYGPSSSFWLFAFERMNGILGSVSTNHQAIEIQLMRKFISNQQILDKVRKDADKELVELLEPFQCLKGSLKHEQIPELPLLSSLSPENALQYSQLCSLLPPVHEGCLKSEEVADLNRILKHYFGDQYIRTVLIHTYSKALIFQGTVYGSVDCCHSNSALIYAADYSGTARPAFASKYISVNVVLSTNAIITVFMARINWLIDHEMKHFYGANVEVWQKFLPHMQQNTFIPVTNIKCRCAYVNHTVKFNRLHNEEVTIVVPLNDFSGL